MLKFNVTILTILFIILSLSTIRANSVATSDDFLAPYFNPSALSFGNAAGIAFKGYYDEDFHSQDFDVIFNSDNLSFIYGKRDNADLYSLVYAQKTFRNLYFGYDMNWRNKYINKADYGLSMLLRPANPLSLGVNIRNLNRNAPTYIAGIGIKPPWFAKSNALILTTDVSYTKSNDSSDYAISNQTLGLETNLIDGLSLAGRYNLDTETFSMNISLSHKRLRTGSLLYFNEDNKISHGAYYVNVAQRDYSQLHFTKQRQHLQEMTFRKPIVDQKEQMKFGPFVIIKDQTTLTDLMTTINRLKDDDRVAGIVLKNPVFPTSYANLEQLQRTFKSFRDTGKPIYVYADNYGNLHYAFLASIADKLYLNPNGSVAIQGFSIGMPYINEMLDKIGITIYDLKSHDYKTATNMFTETEMTQYEREAYEALLDVYFNEMADMIETGRMGKIAADAATMIDNGPYLDSRIALNLGLVDKLIFEDELNEELKQYHKKPKITKEYPNEEIVTVWSEKPKKKIAIIYATGSIHTGTGIPGRTIGSKSLSEQIRKARKDKTVKGIIMRVDSGGGSAFASDVIDREIQLCRETDIPVVVSMGGAAASGGYYISANANRIVAEKTTITGSIGATGMIPNFKRTFDKLLIHWSFVNKGENADLLSPFREVQEDELNIVRDYIHIVYEQFVRTVAKGRVKSYEEIHRVAQGRIWSGYDAERLELIDELGGLDKAILVMKELTGYNEIELVDYSQTYRRIPLKISTDGLVLLPLGISSSSITRLINTYRGYFANFEDDNYQYLLRPIEITGLE